jgi:hypothetical protein
MIDMEALSGLEIIIALVLTREFNPCIVMMKRLPLQIIISHISEEG